MVQRQRSYSYFALDAFIIVKIDVVVNHLIGFQEGSWFAVVNAFCFEVGKKSAVALS